MGNTQPLLIENDNIPPLDSQNYYHARSGTYLFQRCWQVNQNVPLKGIVFLFHGLHEHIGRYEIIANKLTDKGFVVHGIDLHGHGRSVCETRGILPDYHIIIQDWAGYIEHTLTQYKSGVPVYVLAHSMGGVIATLVILDISDRIKIENAVFTGIATYPGIHAASPFGIECLYCITQISCLVHCLTACTAQMDPSGPNSPIDTRYLSHNLDNVKLIETDEFHLKFPVKNMTARQAVLLIDQVKARYHEFTVPCLVLHGREDSITNCISSEEFGNSIGSSSSSHTIIIDGMYHEIMNERVTVGSTWSRDAMDRLRRIQFKDGQLQDRYQDDNHEADGWMLDEYPVCALIVKYFDCLSNSQRL